MNGSHTAREKDWFKQRWQSHLKRNPHLKNQGVHLYSAKPLESVNAFQTDIFRNSSMEEQPKKLVSAVSTSSDSPPCPSSPDMDMDKEDDSLRPKAKPWAAVSKVVNKTDENTNIVPSGTFGQLRVDQRLVKIKDKQQRREDAVKLLKQLEEKFTMLWFSMANNTQCEEFILTFLAGGSWFVKINDKHKTYKRFFYYEKHRKMIYYEGSKKRTKGKHLPRYDSRDIIDVRHGHQTDVFNKTDGKYQEDCCFSIIMSGRTPINLVADYPEIADLWVRGLKFLIYANDRLQKLHDEKQWIADYFYSADANNDHSLEFEEVWGLLQKMSVKMSKKEAKARFHKPLHQKADKDKVTDTKGNLTLNLQEFGQFYHDICKRDEVAELFKRCSSHPEQLWMNVDDLHNFLRNEQGFDYSEAKVKQLIDRFEPSVAKRRLFQLSFDGFLFLINSNLLSIRDSEHNEVYQDMTQPLTSYFISSSHNTYLLEDQLYGPSSIEGYIKALMLGCRCVELDCWDGDNGPTVYHGYTLTSRILFKDIIEDAIKHYAFFKTQYPLILSLENHCSIEQQQIMADILTDTLKDMLYTQPVSPAIEQLPSPEELKGKILIKCRKLPAGITEESSIVAMEDSDDEMNITTSDDVQVKEMLKNKKKGKMRLAKKLSDLVTYVQSVHFHGFDVVRKQGKPYEMSSYSEKKALKLIDEEPGEFVNHTNIQLCRIYPAGTRTDSSNYNPVDMWNVGCQLVSLNFQTSDRAMQIYRGKFKDNGSCGYILKPEFMRKSITFNPRAGAFPESWGRLYTIKVLSGSHLPKPEGDQNTSDLVDPYVKLEIFGVKEDCCEFKTAAITDNGLNPRWNETFEIFISVPELAILRVNVKDHQTLTTNDSIGQCSLPVTSIQRGYRHVMLETKEGLNLCPASVFMHISIQSMSRTSWNSKKAGATSVKRLLGNTTLVNGRSRSRESGEASDISRQSSIRS
ncbi:1-phosphatidylinositol 4,5-bisphosphate phosphodiesterase delta-1-like [Watersipora subatra]|uniref:1-phosphatidylinositol 4,5-bisphosphate phosphodiesterase delta-1-like n=1 Tax=Watersipora subatra TaxID=2589382 RepID=UPI00355B9528